MTRDAHEQAREMIACTGPEGLPAPQQQWLQAHLRDCDSCREYARIADELVRSLHSIPIAAGPVLVRTTQMRVRLHAQRLQQRRERLWLVWLSSVLVSLSAAITTPLLWRGFQWLGEWTRLSNPVWQVGFVMFWIAPTVAVSVLFLAWGTHLADRNGMPQG